MNRYYQQGGEMEQLMQLFQAFADAVQDDEFSTAEEVMQMFQQLSPQEQQQFVQQAMQIVQQEQSEAPEQEQMEIEEEPVMQYGGYVNDTGYLEGYETSNNPYNIIPSNRITMKGIDPKIKYIKGTDNLGNTQYMEHGGEYEFDGDFVLEEPVYAQSGTDIKRFRDRLSKIESKYKNTKTYKEKLILQRTKESLQNQINNFQSLSNKYETLLNQGFGDTKQANDLKNRLNKSIEALNIITPENYKELTINTGAYAPSTNTFIFEPKKQNKKQDIILPIIETKQQYQSKFIPNTDIEILKQPKEGYYIGSDGNQYFSKDKGKTFEIAKDDKFSLKQDKPKTTLPSKKLNKAVAKQVANPDVLAPSSVPTEVPEQVDTFDYRKPLLIDPRFDSYSIPMEEREVNINPNAFNRTNIGVGKKFFKQQGGYDYAQNGYIAPEFEDISLPVNKRLQYNQTPYIGAKTNMNFNQPYTNKMRLFPKIAEPELDPINQYDTMPMGVNSRNYEAPNAQSRSMFEGKGSNQLLDLSNYASRFDEDNFGMTTTPISNQAVNRKSKFEEFMDKYGKKSDLEFNPNVNQVAPYYNLMKASEPLAGQYRANVDLKYAETPLLDPLPVIQQIQNQQRLATQNINTNSPTGQSYLSNLTAQTQQKTMEVLNDIQQKNQQIAAQNEQARINAYNQEMQLNIAANQQYLQNQMQAQAAKDLAMGEALSTIDQMQANKVKEKHYFNSLAATTPGLKKSTNLSNMITGTQGFDVDKDYQKLYYALSQAKTPEEIAAIQKAHQQAMEQKKKTVAQTGGRLNSFFKNKSF